ncbi:MAG: aspartate--ammonia ligase [Clostridia bacterium]|nr:aspartate--ammonia ligase [Clostridia bacterium]
MSTYETVRPYESKLGPRDTQRAIKMVKDAFQTRLAAALNLDRVTAPVIVEAGRGINDDLSGVERKITFDTANGNLTVEVVQSLAKWKRMQLAAFGYGPGEGIYTDMNAVRRADEVDHLHSLFVDQWDWERVLSPEERNREFLHEVVLRIVETLADVKEQVSRTYPSLTGKISREVFFVTAPELEEMYPTLTRKERENAVTREHGTVFLEQIGVPLSDGLPHDSRAPDYDDWTLNGDILVWNEVLGCAEEISSMGIRVDAARLDEQLRAAGATDRRELEYHRGVLEGKYPLTVGGGIGQSRLCMLLLEKAHVGEVQSSVWPESHRREMAEKNIFLL